MEKYFPLYFKKPEAKIIRGLSVKQSEKNKDKPFVYLNPLAVPQRRKGHSLTIVWDLDQTLISADGIKGEDELDPNTELVIRPHAIEILNILKRNSHVEFIVWTMGTKKHAERVVGSFPEIKFDYIIARDSCWYNADDPVKNLNLISNDNRPLNTIILIDDRMDIGTKHPENLLVVPPYYPKKSHVDNDSTMLYLVNIVQRAIDKYDHKHNFSSYLFSPLTEKCTYNGHNYYGVKCFENLNELKERINRFEMME